MERSSGTVSPDFSGGRSSETIPGPGYQRRRTAAGYPARIASSATTHRRTPSGRRRSPPKRDREQIEADIREVEREHAAETVRAVACGFSYFDWLRRRMRARGSAPARTWPRRARRSSPGGRRAASARRRRCRTGEGLHGHFLYLPLPRASREREGRPFPKSTFAENFDGVRERAGVRGCSAPVGRRGPVTPSPGPSLTRRATLSHKGRGLAPVARSAALRSLITAGTV